MKFFLFFGLFFLKFTFLFSQKVFQKSIDSLQILIKEEKNDIDKIRHYKTLIEIYITQNIKDASTYNEILFKIASKTNSFEGLAFYYQNKALINEYTDDFKKAVYCSERARFFFHKINDKEKFIFNSCRYACYLNHIGEKEKALTELNKTLVFAKSNNTGLEIVYLEFCLFYNNSSDYISALKYAKMLLNENKSSKINQARIYHILSRIYISLKNYEMALEYTELGLKKSNDNDLYAYNNASLNKVIILFAKKEFRTAIDLALEIKTFFKNNNYLDHERSCNYFISLCYYELREYRLADIYIDKNLSLGFMRRDLKIKEKTQKAKISLALNQLNNAQKNVSEILPTLKENDYFELILNLYEVKADLDEKLNDYSSAVVFYKKIDSVKELINRNYNKNKIQQLQVDLDITEKNNKIKNLEISQLKKEAEINNKNKYLVYISFGFTIALLSILFYIRNDRIIKKKNQIIEKEKLLIKKSLIEKETLLKEIHHRVKNNLQLVMSLLYIQSKAKNSNITDFIEISQSRILSMSLIHECLYGSDNLSKVDFKNYIQNLTQSIGSSYIELGKNIDLRLDVDEVSLDIQKAIPLGLIINELVNNAYKHAFLGREYGIITVSLKGTETCVLYIKDNGIGITDKESIKKTLGLELVRQLVSQIEGTFEISHKEGVLFCIKFENINH